MRRAIKQGFWATAIVYCGVILGYVNRIILFPKFLTIEEMGLYSFIISNALMLSPLIMAGFGPVLIKFFPYFNRDRTQRINLYTFSFVIPAVSFVFWCVLLVLFSPAIENFFAEKSASYMEYFHLTILLTLLIVFYSLLEIVSRIHQSIILPNFLREFLTRFFALLMAVAVGLGLFPFQQAIYSVLIAYGLALLILLRHVSTYFDFRLNTQFFKIRKMWRKRILEFGGYSMLMGLSSMILLNIDQIFIAKYLGMRDNGIYTLAFYIAIIIGIPRRVIIELVAPKLSLQFRDKAMNDVDRLYKMVSVDQTLIAVVLLLGIIMSVQDLFGLIPKGDELKAGFTVVVFIAFAKLIEMTFSVNANIIAMSPLYRYNVPLIILFMLLNISMNWILIPRYGIDGAAAASLISALLFSLAKMIFVWYRLGVQPFSWQVLWIYLTGIIIYLVVREIPFEEGKVLSIVLRSLLISILYFAPLYFMRVSRNMNYLIAQVLGIIYKRLGRS
ncbi:MAG: oligosaccharide flippase family protein [Bacteroidota bacterium]